MRKDFKEAKISDEFYAYPLPVVRNKKYLIQVEKKFMAFFITTWANNFLTLPDNFPEYLKFSKLHEDQQTKIYTINYNILEFRFLTEAVANDQKSLTIQSLLSTKIISFLNNEDNSKLNLKKTFSNQKKCKTCKSLGILDPNVSSWLSILLNENLS